MSQRADRMFERRTVQRERVEVLIAYDAYDTGGDETWVDLQDWLDTWMVIPEGEDLGLTFAEIKRRYAPEVPPMSGNLGGRARAEADIHAICKAKPSELDALIDDLEVVISEQSSRITYLEADAERLRTMLRFTAAAAVMDSSPPSPGEMK